IREIAHLLGFSDPYYFSRLFKKKTGHSPKAFRLQSPAIKSFRGE
ncbi:MAG: AraC family transcriptional regulator, partial [Spirochaetia bacterium]|nr:AraC family transcriptional regulator [Spirochaetia bacterium]